MKLPLSQQVRIRAQLSQLELRPREEFYTNDPVLWLDRSLPHEDLEILAFILSGLTYGRVEQIQKSFTALLLGLKKLGLSENGKGLANFVKGLSKNEKLIPLKNWKHRLNTHSDLIMLFLDLHKILTQKKSLCQHFEFDKTSKYPLEKCLVEFSKFFHKTESGLSQKWLGTGSSWWAPNPLEGSACKRILMWLRWMVRDENPDVGIWSLNNRKWNTNFHITKKTLLVPLDTHVLRWAKTNKVTNSNSANWSQVKIISQFLLTLFPDDPLKYDYLICHQGMSEFRERHS
jgi:uncharacterized protein (TIGR02757 family)